MYFDTAATVNYCRRVASGLIARGFDKAAPVDTCVVPSFLAIPAVAPVLLAAGAAVGAQDLCQEDRGAFTGEVSGADLRAAGCSVAEVGHAERRSIYAESDDLVAAKTAASLRNGMTPLLCVGESEKGSVRSAIEVCVSQTRSAVGEPQEAEIWLAYEPRWAIGAAEPAPFEYVREDCGEIRAELADSLPGLRILYGGSAGPGLWDELHTAVDGLFLGRFAHDPEAFLTVVDEAVALDPPSWA